MAKRSAALIAGVHFMACSAASEPPETPKAPITLVSVVSESRPSASPGSDSGQKLITEYVFACAMGDVKAGQETGLVILYEKWIDERELGDEIRFPGSETLTEFAVKAFSLRPSRRVSSGTNPVVCEFKGYLRINPDPIASVSLR